MSKSHVISKFRFLEYGKKAPEGSRFKGIINTSSLLGWMQYTERENAADTKKEKTLHEGGLLGYTSQNGRTRTFSSDGWLDNEKLNKFKSKIAEAFSKDGDLFWDTVVSLRDYEDSFQSGMHDVNDYAAIVAKLLPEFFRSAGFDPENMLWWMNYHNNKNNPHMHIVFMEKIQTRTKGKLRQDVLDKYKRVWLKELGLREEFAKKYGISSKEYLQQKDNVQKEILSKVKIDIDDKTIRKLYSMLPKKGRLSYNSKPIKPFKKYIDQITTSLLHDPEVLPVYEEWLKKIETLDRFQNELASDHISTFKENEIKKLYTRMGNLILQNSKYKDTVVKTQYNLAFLKKYIVEADDKTTKVKLHDIPMMLDIPNEYITRNERGVYHVNLEEIVQGFDVYEKDQSPKHMDAHSFFNYLHGIEEPEPKEKRLEVPIDRPNDPIESNIENEHSNPTEDITKAPATKHRKSARNLGGIKKTNKTMHKENLTYILKKGARRLLNQDEREKERDLDKFIRQYEEQQFRAKERGVEYT